MVQNYVFMTDSDSDLPYALKARYDIPVVYMPYTLEGKEYFDDLGQSLDHKAFFDKMRAGAQPSTSALNEMVYLDYFEPVLESGLTTITVTVEGENVTAQGAGLTLNTDDVIVGE